MSEVIITEGNFEAEVLKAELPVLVDFYADWCGPCQMLAPIIAELSKEFADRIKVCKLNVSDGPSITNKYGVTNIPTLILFKEGKPANTIVGYHSKTELLQLLSL